MSSTTIDEDAPFNIGGIVEKNTSKPQSLPGSATKSSSSLKPMMKNSTPGASFPKPMPNKRYTTREETTTTSSSIGGFSQKPINSTNTSANRNNNNNNNNNPSLSSAPPKNERLIETSEFLQILRETMSKSSSTTSSIKLDAGSQEKLPENNIQDENSLSTTATAEVNNATSMDTILRVARSSVPAQRAAALRTLQARCEKFDTSNNSQQRSRDHGLFINAPLEVASSLFDAEEAGPRLAMLAHLAYEDANQTVREAALLMWLTMLSSEVRDDDILDTLVLASITGAPTDDGDEKGGEGGNDDDDADEDSEEQKKIDQEELRKRRLLAGGDTVPREMDDVDLRCGPTGVRIERKYFTLEAVSKLLTQDPALGLARLGVYRTLLDRAVGRAADHDPSGSSLDPNVGGATLLDNRSLWRAVAIASHESPTAAAYICEHKSFFTAFQLLLQATIGAHRGRQIPTTLVGSQLLPCVRDALIAVLSAIHSNSNRAHRVLPKLWSEGGIFLFLKYLELALNEESKNTISNRHVDPTTKPHHHHHHVHCARDHFKKNNSFSSTASSNPQNNIVVAANQCCALLCSIIRAAVRFGVPLSSESLPFEEAEEREKLELEKLASSADDKKDKKKGVTFSEDDKKPDQGNLSKNNINNYQNPETSTWFGEVYSFLVFTARHVGAFAVLEMLLINSSKDEENNNNKNKKSDDKKSKTKKTETVVIKNGQEEIIDDDEEEEEEEEIKFVKTDLKKTIDQVVFPCVEKTLDNLLGGGEFCCDDDDVNDETEEAEEEVGLAATTGIHLLATWIGEGSLLAVFYGDREDGEVLFKKIEPLLEKSLKVMQQYIFSTPSATNTDNDENSNNNNNNACIVFDSFAHGLARFIDVVSKFYPKIRSRVAFHLQEVFSVLITTGTSSVFSTSNNNNKNNQENGDEDVIYNETKQMVAEILSNNSNNQNRGDDGESNNLSSSLLTFSSKESSLSRLTRLSAVGELLRTAQWMMMMTTSIDSENKQQQQNNEETSSSSSSTLLPSVLIRNEVVTCVALNLVSVAMRNRGAADTAVSAGLSLLLPLGQNDSTGTDVLRETLANLLIDITSSSQPKVTSSLPVSLRLDPLSAWILNPCLFVAASTTTAPANDEGNGNNNTREKDIQKKQNEVLLVEVRVAWATWLCDLVTKVSTIASSVSIASASAQIRSLLPHPLSILSSTFLSAFCTEDARENPPKFFSASPHNRKIIENLAVTSFIMCCGSQKSAEIPRTKEVLRQIRKETLETICRGAEQNSDSLELLFLLTVACLLRGSADTWAPLLGMWLERANWIYYTKELIKKSKLIQQCCRKEFLVPFTNNQELKNNNKEVKKSSCGQPLLFTKDESSALQHATSIIESLSSAAHYLPPDSSAGPSSLPFFVKAALVAVAQLSAPCGDFVKNEILSAIEDRLWFGAEDTVKQLQEKCLDFSSSSNNVYEFWIADLA